MNETMAKIEEHWCDVCKSMSEPHYHCADCNRSSGMMGHHPDGCPRLYLFIDDHSGGYWTSAAEWDAFVANSAGLVSFRVLRAVWLTSSRASELNGGESGGGA